METGEERRMMGVGEEEGDGKLKEVRTPGEDGY